MEDFSDQQLWVLILLMLLGGWGGGGVFTSMLGLHLNARANTYKILQKRLPSTCRDIDLLDSVNRSWSNMEGINPEVTTSHKQVQENKCMNQKYCKILAHVVAGYFVVGVICSCLVVTIYIWTNSEAKYLLKSKNIKIWTFAIFTAVSSFLNCGFTPVNDNMAIFRKNPGFLLLVIPQILAGNTLFTPLLRLSIWAFERVSRREEYTYILQYLVETGYTFMQQQKNAINLVLTAVEITLLQMMLLCYFGWDSKPLEGLNWFQKLVCMLFQSVNTRHAGEAAIDISNLSPAILVLFTLFMSVSPPTPVHIVNFSEFIALR
ncbi:cation transporter HKT4-like [Panicum miliaceum]|uniref:Cation transporter HKT4-like n=1 Tax=Panicum miliaceum TaxID=4540 RepID=A0A3L6Q787_PANMI|nr:cation transporter HKT4-like [Panicum miliaceum]